MKQFTKKMKITIVDEILKLLEIKKGYLNLHLCSKYNTVLNRTRNKSSIKKMEIEFPELYKEIMKRRIRRKSMFAWQMGNRKIRIKFLKKFKETL